MMQDVIAVALVVACGAWLGWMVYRFFRPAPGGNTCGGTCCSGGAKKPAEAAGAATGERVMMISSDDMRARLKARR